MSDIGDMIAYSVMVTMVLVFAAGVAVAMFIVFAIPWLWHLLKPILHILTG